VHVVVSCAELSGAVASIPTQVVTYVSFEFNHHHLDCCRSSTLQDRLTPLDSLKIVFNVHRLRPNSERLGGTELSHHMSRCFQFYTTIDMYGVIKGAN
jgi:hypothetical protein